MERGGAKGGKWYWVRVLKRGEGSARVGGTMRVCGREESIDVGVRIVGLMLGSNGGSGSSSSKSITIGSILRTIAVMG